MLDASGKSSDAAPALDQALSAAAKRPDLYLRATSFLVSKGSSSEALRRIDEASRILPENREILLSKATTLEFARHTDDAERGGFGEENLAILRQDQIGRAHV